MYHIELRQFPHNMCRFNLSEQELLAPYRAVGARAVDRAGRTQVEPAPGQTDGARGTRAGLDQLKMSRGWRNAQRQSEDVTERVLAAAKQAAEATVAAVVGDPGGLATGSSAPRDASETGLLSLLGPDPAALLQAWRLVVERRPELSPSESLELAEETLTSLERNQP